MNETIRDGKGPMLEAAEIQIGEFLNRFTLIVGEINRGKTGLTQRILSCYCQDYGGPVTVVDLAPSITPSDLKGKAMGKGVGGSLQVPASEAIRYFHGRLHPPRLRARDEREAEHLAEANARAIELIFQEALGERIDALFINDCSLYLHAGDPRRMLRWIRTARTAVVNGYHGQSFVEGRLSQRERQGMSFLMAQCDRLIQL